MVIVLDKNKRPLGHCSEKHARKLFEKKRACIYRYYPMVIILMDADARDIRPEHRYRIKIDPGAVHTGISVVEGDRVVLMMQVEHRGRKVVEDLKTRAAARRNRRSRETRYRRPGFKKGQAYQTARDEGWLPPSQRSIADNVATWVRRLIRWLGPCDVSVETVKFDTQLLDNPEIEGTMYQQGTLLGYEMKSYLRERYSCTCQYCAGMTEDRRLEWEHMLPRSRGGSDSVKNATLSCRTCNLAKSDRTPDEWLSMLKEKRKRTELDDRRISCLEKVISGRKVGGSNRYAAWATTTRWYLYNGIRTLNGVLSAEASTGGRTSWNRHTLGMEKDHHLDALCVGRHIPETGFRGLTQKVLYIRADGRGSRLRGNLNACGIISTKWYNRRRRYGSFQKGDIVCALIPAGRSKYAGRHIGKLYTRDRDTWAVKPFGGKQFDLRKEYVTLRQSADGYTYSYL